MEIWIIFGCLFVLVLLGVLWSTGQDIADNQNWDSMYGKQPRPKKHIDEGED